MNKPSVQSAGFLLELSPDWLILRASENARAFLGEYHQRLIGEPLSRFTLAQSLHDLRNSLARQRSSSGIARAYRVRLIDDPRYFDIAFRTTESTILLEGLPSADAGFGEWLGSVGRLVEGLQSSDRSAMLENAARRMRALTGYDRVALRLGDQTVESSRGRFSEVAVSGDLPPIVADTAEAPVAMFPRNADDGLEGALLRSPTLQQIEELRSAGIGSTICVPVLRDGESIGWFECDSRSVRTPSFELHAAAELYAQMFGLLLPSN